jgi:hypothetical protein
LTEDENWLYSNGLEANKSTYSKKIDKLRAIGDPIIKRYNEFHDLPEKFEQMAECIDSLENLANSKEFKYAHISQEDRNKVFYSYIYI